MRYLVTSALPYVNNVPHMGNIIGCVLSADVFARYQRCRGNEVLYVCGTDEHGTATETKAQEEGLSPRQICDKYHEIHRRIYEWFTISFDIFGRTSMDNHHRIVQEIFADVKANGFIRQQDVEQAYCPKDQKFLADRFVQGECPHCHYADARGDQCDSCGKLLDPLELIKPRCKTCGTAPIRRASTHLFLDLTKLQPRLQEWVDTQSVAGDWTQNAITTTHAWLDRGLEPRAITRDLSWGVPVPGMEGKVFYVWFDAPIGYISITGQKEGVDWRSWWQADDVKLYQFMAKDNIPFHTILFPATLMGTGQEWTMLHHIDSTEYLQHEDGKFSKSRGVGLFGDDVERLPLPADVYRYYLLINRPETADTLFAWKDLQEKLNNELLANLGNLVNRTLQFLAQFQDHTVHESVLDETSANFREWIVEQAQMTGKDLDAVHIRDALKRIMMISQKANAYFQEQAPWKARTEDPERCRMSMYVLANTIKDLAILLEPFLPTTSQRIFAQLGIPAQAWDDIGDLSVKGRIGTPEPLFQKLDDKGMQEIRRLLAEKSAPARKPLQVTAGRIIDVFRHPKADKLFVEQVDMGGEIRNIVSGLVGHYTQDELKGRTAWFVTNLQPAILRGVESQGMILAAQAEGKVEVLFTELEPGTRWAGMEGDAPQITIDEFAQHEVHVRSKSVFLDGKEVLAANSHVTTKEIPDGIVK